MPVIVTGLPLLSSIPFHVPEASFFSNFPSHSPPSFVVPIAAVIVPSLPRAPEIVLPSYWKDLVHAEGISVQIQNIGVPQMITVESFDNEKIFFGY